MRMRIMIADQKLKIWGALTALVQRKPGWVIVGSATSGMTLLNKAAEVRPDVLIVDYTLPGLKFKPAVRMLKSDGEMLIIVTCEDPEAHAYALANGADYFVCSARKANQLIDALHDCSQRLSQRPGFCAAGRCQEMMPYPPQVL